MAKDNMLEEVEDELELEQDAPVEEQLEVAAKIIREIGAQLDIAEKNFKVHMQSLFRLARASRRNLSHLLFLFFYRFCTNSSVLVRMKSPVL